MTSGDIEDMIMSDGHKKSQHRECCEKTVKTKSMVALLLYFATNIIRVNLL